MNGKSSVGADFQITETSSNIQQLFYSKSNFTSTVILTRTHNVQNTDICSEYDDNHMKDSKFISLILITRLITKILKSSM